MNRIGESEVGVVEDTSGGLGKAPAGFRFNPRVNPGLLWLEQMDNYTVFSPAQFWTGDIAFFKDMKDVRCKCLRRDLFVERSTDCCGHWVQRKL